MAPGAIGATAADPRAPFDRMVFKQVNDDLVGPVMWELALTPLFGPRLSHTGRTVCDS